MVFRDGISAFHGIKRTTPSTMVHLTVSSKDANTNVIVQAMLASWRGTAQLFYQDGGLLFEFDDSIITACVFSSPRDDETSFTL